MIRTVNDYKASHKKLERNLVAEELSGIAVLEELKRLKHEGQKLQKEKELLMQTSEVMINGPVSECPYRLKLRDNSLKLRDTTIPSIDLQYMGPAMTVGREVCAWCER